MTFGSDNNGKSHTVDTIIDFIAGVNGGAACVAVGQPLDTVKVKLQTFPQLYKGAWDCFKRTVKNEGVRGLYAGTVPSLAANIAENSVLFAGYGVCQKVVMTICGVESMEKLGILHNCWAGAGAAVFSSFALCPTELVKCRLQAMRESQLQSGGPLQRIGPWTMTKDILRQEGVPGLFRGLTSTFAREVPGYFFFFGTYDLIKTMLTPEGKTKSDLGPLPTAFAGGLGGAALWTAIFPFDVVKSRVQVQSMGGKKTLGLFATLMHIFRNEGIRALYQGLTPTIIRTIPATGAIFVTVEWTKKTLNGLRD